jgi:hypothetical protein
MTRFTVMCSTLEAWNASIGIDLLGLPLGVLGHGPIFAQP